MTHPIVHNTCPECGHLMVSRAAGTIIVRVSCTHCDFHALRAVASA